MLSGPRSVGRRRVRNRPPRLNLGPGPGPAPGHPTRGGASGWRIAAAGRQLTSWAQSRLIVRFPWTKPHHAHPRHHRMERARRRAPTGCQCGTVARSTSRQCGPLPLPGADCRVVSADRRTRRIMEVEYGAVGRQGSRPIGYRERRYACAQRGIHGRVGAHSPQNEAVTFPYTWGDRPFQPRSTIRPFATTSESSSRPAYSLTDPYLTRERICVCVRFVHVYSYVFKHARSSVCSHIRI